MFWITVISSSVYWLCRINICRDRRQNTQPPHPSRFHNHHPQSTTHILSSSFSIIDVCSCLCVYRRRQEEPKACAASPAAPVGSSSSRLSSCSPQGPSSLSISGKRTDTLMPAALCCVSVTRTVDPMSTVIHVTSSYLFIINYRSIIRPHQLVNSTVLMLHT